MLDKIRFWYYNIIMKIANNLEVVGYAVLLIVMLIVLTVEITNV